MCDMYFFFFKQKTAYEMRISDWSSDVCSSDLAKSGEKLPRIQSLIAVSAARTAGPCHRLRITAASSTASGVKKTGRLRGCFGGAGKESADKTGWARQHGGCPARGQLGRNGPPGQAFDRRHRYFEGVISVN